MVLQNTNPETLFIIGGIGQHGTLVEPSAPMNVDTALYPPGQAVAEYVRLQSRGPGKQSTSVNFKSFGTIAKCTVNQNPSTNKA